MLLPASREQIRKLGERLAAGDPISPEDDHFLEELVACHLRALELARPRLDGLAKAADTGPLHITARAKTTGTIIEKLRPSMACRLRGWQTWPDSASSECSTSLGRIGYTT